ncbi:MAG: ABC transporter permease [Methanomassiliicoccus sp.]|nr:ABC transporter permease [Methanomassiliicoccus sp.]
MSKLSSQLLASILVNAIYEMRNYPVILINTLISPLSFLILIFFVSRGELLGVAILGGMIMTMFQSGMFLQADLSHLKNDFRLQEMVVASPTGAGSYVAGMALSELIYSSPALVILIALFALFVPVTAIQALAIAVVMLLMFLTSVSLGFALATVSSDIVQSFGFSRLITTLFSTLAPVYYPLNLIPQPFQWLAYLSPTTYTARLVQALAGFVVVPLGTMVLDAAVVLSLTLVFLYIGIRKSRWRER